MITATADTHADLPVGPSLERNRTVLEIVNDTFDLVRRHRTILVRPFLQTVLLPITIGQILVNLFFEQVRSNITRQGAFYSTYFSTGSDSADLFLFIAGIFLTFLGTLWGIALFNSLVLIELESDEVAGDEGVFQDRYRELRSIALAAGFGLIMVVVVIALPLFLIGQLPLIGTLLMFAALILISLYFVRLSLFFPARLIEENSFSGSFSRSIELVKGAWWRTLGLLILGILITALFSMAGYMPMFIYTMIAGVGVVSPLDPTTSIGIILTVLLGSLYGVGQALGLVTHLSLALHFLARRDARDVTSLHDAVERIGQGVQN